MPENSTLIGNVGIVAVGTLQVTIGPLSQAEETTLDKILRKAAEKVAGDHYTRCKPALDAAGGNDRLEMLREVTRMAGRQDRLSPAAFWEYRTSPAGTAIELYHRGRKYTDGLSPEGLAAVITDANVEDVSAQLFSVLEGGDPKAIP